MTEPYFFILVEPQLHHYISFLVRAKNLAQAKSKIRAHADLAVKQTHDAFKGLPDQEYMIRSTRDYWNIGLRNISAIQTYSKLGHVTEKADYLII
jgi:hypothetical protein